MARINGSLRTQSAIRMKQERRDKELAALFGRDLVEDAHQTDPISLTLTPERMDAVHDAADKLLAEAGNTVSQRRTIMGLDAETRLALCMWVMDLELGAKLVAIAIRDKFRVCG